MITHKIALRAAWIAFFSVLAVGLLTALLLSLGAANPPRAGALQWYTDNLVYSVPPHKQVKFLQHIDLPKPPYTLDISAVFTAGSDPMAIWGVSLRKSTELLGVYLNGYQFYSVPPIQPDFTPFIHLRKAGIANKITIHVEADFHITIRINDEIAWRGVIPGASTAEIYVKGGINQPTTLILNSIELYYPTP